MPGCTHVTVVNMVLCLGSTACVCCCSKIAEAEAACVWLTSKIVDACVSSVKLQW